uniref:Uncharacterized protein n=1 Tax=Anopheles farauti TaxID=69004 RepID=A0A182QS95_9DIPT
MRTKASVRYIAKVVRQQESSTVSASPATVAVPAPTELENEGHLAILPTTVLDTYHHRHVNDAVKSDANTATTSLKGKIRKPRTKKPDVGGVKPMAPARRKRTTIGGPEETDRALYQIDFAQLVQRNLRALQQAVVSNPMGMSLTPLPKLVPLNHHPAPYIYSTAGCHRQMELTSPNLNSATVLQHRSNQVAGQRFSIFRSVELMAQSSCQHHHQQQLDYQLTPALYLLNQQAEILQKSLVKTNTKKTSEGGSIGSKPQRKQRGPYKRRTNKTLSPTVSPAPDFDADNTERLSSSDLAGSNTRFTGLIEAGGAKNEPQQQRKRKSDSFLDTEQQQTLKQTRTLHYKQSIFRDVNMMAVSSCAQPV